MRYFLYSILVFGFLALGVAIPMAFQIKADIPKSHNNIVGFYTQSLVEDGDLNIINQVPAEMAWLVTEKLNSPDTHSYAGAILLWPVFFYSHVIDSMGFHPMHCLIGNYDEAQALAALFYGALILVLTVSILTHFGVPQKLKILLILSMIAGTPFWWAIFIQPSGSEILGSASLLLALWYLIKASKFMGHHWMGWIGLGALFGFSGLVHFDLLIYMPVPFFLIFSSLEIDKKKTKLSLIAVGMALVLGCHFLNSLIKFGNFYGYFDLTIFERLNYFSSKFFLINEFLGPNGILFTTPIYGMGILGLVLALVASFEKNQNISLKNKFISLLAVSFFVGVLAFFSKLKYDHYYGGLQLISHQVVAILGLCYLYAEIEGKVSQYLLTFATGVSILWSWFCLLRFLAHPDTFGIHYPSLDQRSFELMFESINAKFLLAVNMIPRILPDFVIWSCFCFLLFLAGWLSSKFLKIYISIWIFPTLFIIATLLNLVNSSKNISILDKKGFFSDKVIGNGSHIYQYDNMTSYLDGMSDWAVVRTKTELLSDLDRYRRYFSDIAKQQIVSNSNFFLKDLEKNRYRTSFWRKKVKVSYYDCRDPSFE